MTHGVLPRATSVATCCCTALSLAAATAFDTGRVRPAGVGAERGTRVAAVGFVSSPAAAGARAVARAGATFREGRGRPARATVETNAIAARNAAPWWTRFMGLRFAGRATRATLVPCDAASISAHFLASARERLRRPSRSSRTLATDRPVYELLGRAIIWRKKPRGSWSCGESTLRLSPMALFLLTRPLRGALLPFSSPLPRAGSRVAAPSRAGTRR
jgi:hypothetical protein